MAIDRNGPCPCGSGMKYKKCCLKTGGPQTRSATTTGAVIAVIVVVIAFALGFWVDRSLGILVAIAGLGGVGAYVMFSDPPSSKEGGDPSTINFGG